MAKAIVYGNAIGSGINLAISPESAKAHALTGLKIDSFYIHRALPYAFAFALSGHN